MNAKMLVTGCAVASTVLGALTGMVFAADPLPTTVEKAKSTGYRPSIVVYKNAHCDCCLKWVEHLEAHRFTVRVESVDDLGKVKRRVDVPRDKESCHTAEIEGYFIEGHVPADDIKRLIGAKPDAKGLTVPGMPIGSPGMERGREFQSYDVLLVNKDGTASVFARHEK